MMDRWTDSWMYGQTDSWMEKKKIMLLLYTLTMRGSHVASLVKLRSIPIYPLQRVFYSKICLVPLKLKRVSVCCYKLGVQK